MPRFDFLCRDCQSTFEHLLPPGGEHPLCPRCRSKNVQKLLTPPLAIFKGSGFYATDSKRRAKEAPYKAPNTKKDDQNGKKEAKSDEKTSEGKTGSSAEE